MSKSVIFFRNIIIFFIAFNHFEISGCEKNCENKNVKIVIIGSGSSGIAAAAKLFQNGFNNITILEAEDRIGGRVHSAKIGNYLVDMGGQWVHGEVGNVAFELANPLGLLDHSNESYSGIHEIMFDSQGNRVNDELSERIRDFFFKYAVNPNVAKGSNYTSLGAFAENKFDEIFKDYPKVYNDRRKYLFFLNMCSISSSAADSWHDVSVSEADQFKDCEGDYYTNWKERTYSTILDILMKRYPDPEKELPILANTILDSEVTKINYTQGEGSSKISVTTSKGQTYKADHVIVTVSLGVLKAKHESLFVPPLPDYKVKTIERLGYGKEGKIYLLFDQPFWDDISWRMLDFPFVWNDDDRKATEDDPEKMWTLGVISAYTVEYKPNLLCFWISGEYAKAMEALSEEKVLDHSVELLHRFLDKTYNVTKPIGILRTQWCTNPHFRGTYSFRSMKTLENNVTSQMLEEPLTPENLRVLFAGEATSIDRYSLVDGAIGSGWKAADRLIDYYSNQCQDA